MSRTKWSFSGPVSITPGTRGYHQAGASIITAPLIARIAGRIHFAHRIVTPSVVQKQDEAARADVTWREKIVDVAANEIPASLSLETAKRMTE
jgi:hypothetical protein